MRILGIDTSLRSSGYAVVEAKSGRIKAVEYGVIRNPSGRPHSFCLREIHDHLRHLITQTAPEAAAIEGGFFFKNAKTAMILGEARGVAIAVCASAGIPIYEYSPRSVKQSLTGFGAAQKDQVARMVMTILGLPDLPQEDAGDALAIAICHLQSRSGIPELQEKPI
ncbi:MAG TPA: crossover junction endodeoxyribonuclease RuvC [Verrucomicrobia bacterium]|nr:MAG: crossover junction endodeoxyribonuclease RuvC [Lentisphaerae bacterium GWF2_57_35]HBA86086.1 crossover junction endodeoxyribonuclease RuvC [Verrucomicrobiota bacterium]